MALTIVLVKKIANSDSCLIAVADSTLKRTLKSSLLQANNIHYFCQVHFKEYTSHKIKKTYKTDKQFLDKHFANKLRGAQSRREVVAGCNISQRGGNKHAPLCVPRGILCRGKNKMAARQNFCRILS